MKLNKEERARINKSLLYLSNKMEQAAEGFRQQAMGVKVSQFSDPYLKSFLRGLGFTNVSLPDGKYYLTNWETWKKIILWDWTDKRKYISDRYDCDNFARTFASRATELYGLNSAAICNHTELLNPNTNEHLGWHRHNLIVSSDPDGMHAYLYEPMNDNYVLIKKNEPINMGRWKYKLSSLTIY